MRAPLAEIAKIAEASGIMPPAIFVIGQVVAHAEALGSPTPPPLRGSRIGMFAPRSELSEALQDAGAEILLAPSPLTSAARLVMGSAPLSGWIVQSVRELDALEREKAAHEFLATITLWCLGGAVASLARERNWPTVAELDDDASPSNLVTKLRQTLNAKNSG